jgi:nicotinate phosphoribosyltransferase
MRDTIACRDEAPPRQAVGLLEQVMTGGRRTRPAATIAALRSQFEAQLRDLPARASSLVAPVVPVAATSIALRRLSDEVRVTARAIGRH